MAVSCGSTWRFCVVTQLMTDVRIDVEAVDGWILGVLIIDDVPVSIGFDDRRIERCSAGVVGLPGTAEPHDPRCVRPWLRRTRTGRTTGQHREHQDETSRSPDYPTSTSTHGSCLSSSHQLVGH